MIGNPAASAAQQKDFWGRHLPWRRPFEILIWTMVFGLSAAANTVVTLVDAERFGEVLAVWKPATWEASSAISSLLLLPGLLWICERWPLHVDTWRRRLPGYVGLSVAWCVLHVTGMVLLRMPAYALMGDSYDFHWARELPYEYLKDVRTFAAIVFLAHGYSWLWRRMQGEVRLLDPPDSGVGADQVPPAARPERFLVRKLGREFLVEAVDIEWLQASGNYVNLHVAGRVYPLRATLAGVEAMLDPARFARIHRSYMVNLRCIASIEPLDTGDARIHLRDGAELPCSRSHREAIRARLTPSNPSQLPRNG